MNQPLQRNLINEWLDKKISLGKLSNWEKDEIRLISEVAYLLTLHNLIDEAIVILEGLISLAPNTSYFYETLGALYLRQGNFSQAIKNLNKALVNTTTIIPLVNRGEAYLLSGEGVKAQSDFKQALLLASQKKSEQIEMEKESEIAIRRAYLLLSKMEK